MILAYAVLSATDFIFCDWLETIFGLASLTDKLDLLNFQDWVNIV